MFIKSSEKKEKSMVELTIEVSTDEFDKAIHEAFIKNRNQISVPGFRKGKAPRKIIERMYGVSIFHNDALDIILPTVLNFIDEEAKLRIVGLPEVTNVDIKKDEGGLDLTISAAEYPEVRLGEYKGLSAVKPLVEVLDSEIDNEIEGIRLRNARYEKTDRPAANGDSATIDYEGFIDGMPFDRNKGEDHELEIGSGAFIPGFEEKILGMSLDEERDIDLVFPEDYVDDLAGKQVVFKVKLKDLREKILPDIDDEFAKDVSEFDTLDEYKASIRERFLKLKQEDADAAFENALMDKVVESLEADIPDVMIDTQLEDDMKTFARQVSSYGMEPSTYFQMTNTTPESLRKNMRVSSEKQVKTMIALEKISELEDLEVSEEDIENGYNEAAGRFGMEMDKLKESVSEEAMVREIKFKRAVKIVTDSATAEEPPVEVNESEAPAAAEEKPKKPAAKKTPAKKKTPEAESGAGASEAPVETPQEDAGPAKKPAAKKPRKPKAEETSTNNKNIKKE